MLKLWHVLADAWAEAVSRYMTAVNMPLRGEILYGLDKFSGLRFSHENTAVQMTYDEFLEKPNSHRAHELLHTDLENWDLEMKL